MANLNQAPRMGETNDDDSTESSDLKPVFWEASFDAAQRAKEQEAQQHALQEENQRRILEFLGVETEDDDEEDPGSDTGKKSKKSTPKTTSVEAAEPTPQTKAEVHDDEVVEQEVTSEALPPEYDMASEADSQPVAHETPEAAFVPEIDESQPEVPDIEPVAAAARVELVFGQNFEPDQEAGVADLEPDVRAEASPDFEASSIDEEPTRPDVRVETSTETLDDPFETESGANDPPPPPEDPPVDNFDDFDTPPPPPNPDVEFDPEQPPEEPPTEQIVETRREVVDHYRGGVGAALLAFFTANWLSRRRDRKLRREAQKIEKELKQSQEQAAAERRFVREAQRQAESRRQEQLAKMSQLERAQAEAATAATQAEKESSETKQSPVPVAEVLAAASYSKEQAPEAEVPLTDSQDRFEPGRAEEFREHDQQTQPEQQPEPRPVEAGRESNREIDYERQKEARPDSAVYPVDTTSDGKRGSGRSALDEAEESLSRRDQNDDSLYQVSMPQAVGDEKDLYQKSVAAGVAVGVAVVVLVAAIYFLLF